MLVLACFGVGISKIVAKKKTTATGTGTSGEAEAPRIAEIAYIQPRMDGGNISDSSQMEIRFTKSVEAYSGDKITTKGLGTDDGTYKVEATWDESKGGYSEGAATSVFVDHTPTVQGQRLTSGASAKISAPTLSFHGKELKNGSSQVSVERDPATNELY